MAITYGSVCSGIEAASVAWEPLGLSPAWFAQFDPEHDYSKGPDFPSAVLAHHWPQVPNLGDMTKIANMLRDGMASAPDILVGGTPCQAFSVAGMRKGLDDARGQLTIKFVEIADEIDKQRGAGNECVILWENVPGVLSSKDNAFGCFLAGLVGEDCELVPPGGKWTNAGCVSGPKRAAAWRVLDAQYFGVAQRRRRVFVVASARKDFDPTAVLFEREGVRRDTAPSRETGSVVAALTANGVGTCGADDNQGQAGHLIAVHGTQDPDTNTELAHTLGRNHGQENAVAYSVKTANTSSNGWGIQKEVTHTLDTTQGIAVAAFAENSRQEVRLNGGDGQITGALSCGGGKVGQGYPAAMVGMAVRRLTPTECERLQDFPDGHTAIPYRNKPAADGHRYKALGNSMAVPVIAWLGKRIIKELSHGL